MCLDHRALACACAALAACANSSRLDTPAQQEAADPWAAKPESPDKKQEPDRGFQLFDKLKAIIDGVSKPGPYEAPEQSESFDETKPHWAVLELGGKIVERRAYS